MTILAYICGVIALLVAAAIFLLYLCGLVDELMRGGKI
jgi:hypothetical protein